MCFCDPGCSMMRSFLLLAAFFGFTGVVLGALGAHALQGKLTPEFSVAFQTAVHYQQVHALALLGVAVLALHQHSGWLTLAAWLFCAGILLFSGSLYLLVSGLGRPGLITPLGGLALMGGWLCLGIAAWRSRP